MNCVQNLSLSASISEIPGIGTLVCEVFRGAGFTTIRDLAAFNAQDHLLQNAIHTIRGNHALRGAPNEANDMYWRKLFVRCIDIIQKVKNACHMFPHPEMFLCPITLELFYDPVITPSGHSFERSAVEIWLQYHPNTVFIHPFTREQCDISRVIPNRALQEAVRYYQDNYFGVR